MARVLRLFLMLIGLGLIAACGGSDDETTSDDESASSLQAEATDDRDTPASTEAADSADDNSAETTVTDDAASETDGGGDENDGGDDETAGDAEDEAEGGDAEEGADEAESEDGDDGEEAQTAAPGSATAIDWWGCWQAADAKNADGGTPSNGGRVALLPNCATGPSSVGSAGDMSHASYRPVFRSSGANGNPSIEFTFEGDTLLQTNGGSPWTGDDVLNGPSTGVTLAWVGMTTKVNSHNVKYLVSGLNEQFEYPMLLVEGEGPNRFAGYGGGNIEARSSEGTISDFNLHAVIMYLAPDGSASVVEVDGGDVQAGQDSIIRSEVAGLTLGNIFSRNFSTTDHHFVFLGMYEGQMSDGDKAAFWDYAEGLR